MCSDSGVRKRSPDLGRNEEVHVNGVDAALNLWHRDEIGNYETNFRLVDRDLLPFVTDPQVEAKVPTGKDMTPYTAYLLVYFTDPTHSVHFALSSDGYTFTAVNDGNPVIRGEDIAEQKGIRDPFIMRGPDDQFYMAMTDLHLFAKDLGYRDTEWQRDGDKYGWGNNRCLVLMKSPDLINWSHTNLNVAETYPELGDIGCAWAPEMNYDEEKGRIMLHFTTRFGCGPNVMYWTYMDPSFTRMETKPELLFTYPKEGINTIDSDIIKAFGKYHLFYTPHDEGGGVKHAVSDSLTSGYEYLPGRVDSKRAACEAPNVWKRIGEEKWVLMYDVFGVSPHNFGFSETTDFETFTDIGHFNEGVMKTTNFTSPKHGAVVHLTTEEAKRLADRWNLGSY